MEGESALGCRHGEAAGAQALRWPSRGGRRDGREGRGKIRTQARSRRHSMPCVGHSAALCGAWRTVAASGELAAGEGGFQSCYVDGGEDVGTPGHGTATRASCSDETRE